MTDLDKTQAIQFALIVVNYGSSHLLSENLAGMNLGLHHGLIIVVDNFTTNSERQKLRQLGVVENWTVLELDENVGFGAGVNVGARHAFDLGLASMAVINPDARVSPENLLKLIQATLDDPNVMVSPIIRTSSGAVWFDGMDLYTNSGRVASSRRRVLPAGPSEPWISGACFAVSKYMWESVGGFDEDYFLYWEDVDLSRRVVRQRGRLAVLTDASAVHDEGGTQKSAGRPGSKSEVYYFYNIRNRLIYAAKHGDDAQLKSWIRATPRVSYEILLGGGRRQFLSSIAPFRAYIKGIFFGWQMMKEIQKNKNMATGHVTRSVKGEGSCS
ncbi:glycosyltransferase family 2 protein [Arthrobacter cryoconiti]|uniref:Glycosyltransferase family 2 protein n=1 Tax=Arthrobacter cryoconiti TaxID=748907 RepID=A0ABV8R3W6_9MICC|nr:glycosyltransferase family 2 protein [Arthrobacter cryoconiti]MCC9067012.1 glycosyltransferase family 2 protein [Arthrobacter cryoconiti]